MQDVWVVLEDGRTVDPNEIATDERGVLRHSSGVAVRMRAPGVPFSRGVDAAAERAKAAAAEKTRTKAGTDAKTNGDTKVKADVAAKDIKPEDQQAGYKTREAKAD